MGKLNFNTGTDEQMDDYSVVPADTYNAQIVKSEVVPTQAKTGHIMKLQFKIIDGKFKGRIVFGQYNVDNPNAQAVEISRKQINTLCASIGLVASEVDDSNEMHNIPLQIKVSIKPAQGNYAEQNEIKFYSKYAGTKVTGSGSSGSNAKNPAKGNPANNETASDPVDSEPQAADPEPQTAESSTKAPWAES